MSGRIPVLWLADHRRPDGNRRGSFGAPRRRGAYLFVAEHDVANGRLESAVESHGAAAESSSIDPRRVASQRWGVLVRLAGTQIDPGREADAHRTVSRLSDEAARANSGVAQSIDQSIRRLESEQSDGVPAGGPRGSRPGQPALR